MGQSCSVCEDARLAEIEADLDAGLSYRAAEAKYGLPKSSLNRHRKTCMPLRAALRDARARRETVAPVIVKEPAPDAPLVQETASGAVVPATRAKVRSSRGVVSELEDIATLLRGALADHADAKGGISLPLVRELRQTLELVVKSVLALEAREGATDPMTVKMNEWITCFDSVSCQARVEDILPIIKEFVAPELQEAAEAKLRGIIDAAGPAAPPMFSPQEGTVPWEPRVPLGAEVEIPDVVQGAPTGQGVAPGGNPTPGKGIDSRSTLAGLHKAMNREFGEE